MDTFRTLEPPQAELAFISEKNSERVNKQRKTEIRVVIANPPYNAWQTDENENNRNITYGRIEDLVRQTYGKDSKAQNKNSLSDPYVKAFRYASELIKDNGVIAYVSNGAFVDSLSCDGMRKNLAQDFDLIYVLDLGGNVRKNPKLSGTTHNVFGIQVGVCITLLIKLSGKPKNAKRSAKIYYHAVPVDWRKEKKYEFLEIKQSVEGVKWQKLQPDKKQNWLDMGLREEFDNFLPIASHDIKPGAAIQPIFNEFSNGVKTHRDAYAVNFNRERVAKNMEAMIDAYNGQVDAYHRLKKKPANVEDFIDYESGKIAWSELLKNSLERGIKVDFNEASIRRSNYRPFVSTWLYFDSVMNERRYGFPDIFPKHDSKNSVIWLKVGSDWPMFALMSDRICDLMPQGGSQCFPLYHYVEDINKKKFEQRDNITPKARTLFQIFYDDDTITQADIFHYVYAVLHHPTFRTRFAENLKRDLPRIPFVGVAAGQKNASFFPLSAVETMQGNDKPDHNPKASANLFHAFADAGRKLADLHVNYESAKEFKLKRIENKEVKLDWRVEAMKLTKDKSAIIYNDFLTLSGIPPEVFGYKLGNRSALEWVIDQYRVTRDEKGSIVSDPNRLDDEAYIVRLIGQVITVSLKTMKLVKSLPTLTSP